MDAAILARMLSDKNLFNLKKMQYKYSAANVAEMLVLLKQTMYKVLPIRDFNNEGLVYLESILQVKMSAYRTLFAGSNAAGPYGLKAMEEEIYSTLLIENIRSSRDSIRKILGGYAPADEMENRIAGMKQGLDFISDPANKIGVENIYKLYSLTIGGFLTDRDQLMSGQYYRHDRVYIVGDKVEHQGLDSNKLPEYMAGLVEFINTTDEMNVLIKAAAIHFYFAYLHPYFDGNGRMARLLHLWYLVQQGYRAALFIPFSSFINKTKADYYHAYSQIEENSKISGLVDITPFLIYFIDKVYNQIGEKPVDNETMGHYQAALMDGNITEKEKKLFEFVLSAYGTTEFSTKQLERDFGNAAYATIRSFVMKFEKLQIFSRQSYGNRVKYRVK
jgi:Fic family protein